MFSLKKTLSSVRERFDVERVNAEEKVQKVEAITQTEIFSLRKTISQLREELEQVGIEQEEKIQMQFQDHKLRSDS